MKFNKRFALKAVAAIALVVMLATTAYAFSIIIYRVRQNYFQTGYVEVGIEFADPVTGKVDLRDSDIKYEPGMRVRGDFTITNSSVGDDKVENEDGIWYRVYFTGVSGKLADVMVATVYDGEEALASSVVSKWEDNRLLMDGQHLAHNGSKTLTLELYFPKEAGNAYQGEDSTMEYSLAVVAVQRRNNPGKLFGNK